jgi:hypothetical protein
MTCLHCAAAHQNGRFCIRCGKRMPRTEVSGRAAWRIRRTPASRSREARLREREGVRALRGARRPVPADEAAKSTVPHDAITVQRGDLRGMYDKAMARAAVPARAPLQRYLAVLARTS